MLGPWVSEALAACEMASETSAQVLVVSAPQVDPALVEAKRALAKVVCLVFVLLGSVVWEQLCRTAEATAGVTRTSPSAPAAGVMAKSQTAASETVGYAGWSFALTEGAAVTAWSVESVETAEAAETKAAETEAKASVVWRVESQELVSLMAQAERGPGTPQDVHAARPGKEYPRCR